MKDFVWLVAGGVATELIVMGVVKLWGEMKFLSKHFWLTAFLAALAISLSVVMTSLYFYTQTPRGIDDCAETNAGSNVVAVAEFQRKIAHVKSVRTQTEVEIDDKLNQAYKIIGVGLSSRWEKEMSYVDKTSDAAVKALVEREFVPMLEALVKMDELRLHYHLEIRNHYDAKLCRGINLPYAQFEVLCAEKDGCVKNMEKFLDKIIALHVDGKKNLCEEVVRHIKAHLDKCKN